MILFMIWMGLETSFIVFSTRFKNRAFKISSGGCFLVHPVQHSLGADVSHL
jgi:hypothetical protein